MPPAPVRMLGLKLLVDGNVAAEVLGSLVLILVVLYRYGGLHG